MLETDNRPISDHWECQTFLCTSCKLEFYMEIEATDSSATGENGAWGQIPNAMDRVRFCPFCGKGRDEE